AAKQVTLTVTPPSGQSITGGPVVFDDFDVSVRDGSGEYYAWKRTPDLKVVKNDPYAAHDELLEKYTDKNMHDILAYLVTLKGRCALLLPRCWRPPRSADSRPSIPPSFCSSRPT